MHLKVYITDGMGQPEVAPRHNIVHFRWRKSHNDSLLCVYSEIRVLVTSVSGESRNRTSVYLNVILHLRVGEVHLSLKIKCRVLEAPSIYGNWVEGAGIPRYLGTSGYVSIYIHAHTRETYKLKENLSASGEIRVLQRVQQQGLRKPSLD